MSVSMTIIKGNQNINQPGKSLFQPGPNGDFPDWMTCLLEFDGRASFFELLLCGFSFVLRDLFLHRSRCAIDDSL